MSSIIASHHVRASAPEGSHEPILRDRNILMLSFSDWDAPWSAPQRIASRLVPQNRVLYVNQPHSFLYPLVAHRRPYEGALRGNTLKEISQNLWVYQLPFCFLPYGGLPFSLARVLYGLNSRWMAYHIRRVLDALHFEDVIVWNTSPLHAGAVAYLPHAFHLHDIADEWVNYIRNRGGRRLIEWIEDRLYAEVSLIFVGSDAMAEKRLGRHPHIHVVHYGVDYDAYARAPEEVSEPTDLRGISQPRIGFVGVMDAERFDVEAVERLAQERPEYSVVLVGPAKPGVDIDRLTRCENLFWLGPKPPQAVPQYTAYLDALLIPYRLNEATRYIYPLKLQEYLATGKPVISTPLPAVRPYADVVYIVEDVALFSDTVDRALREDNPERAKARREVARANTWEAKVRQKEALIVKYEMEGRPNNKKSGKGSA